jgi:hypothetical protein
MQCSYDYNLAHRPRLEKLLYLELYDCCRGRSGRKEIGQGTPPDGGTFLRCRKVDSWFPLARKKSEIRFSMPDAGLSSQKSIKRTQKHHVLDVLGHPPPKKFQMPVRQKYYACNRHGLLHRVTGAGQLCSLST